VDIGTAEAAKRLGVHPSRVRQMLQAGDLRGRRVGGRWLVSSSDLARMEGRVRRSGRPLAPARAWGLLHLLDGGRINWLSPVARSQVRSILAHMSGSDADRWRAALRTRALVVPARAHPAAIARILRDPRVVQAGGQQAAQLGIDLVVVDQTPEVYVQDEDWPKFAAEFSLREQVADHNLVVRLPRAIWPFTGRSPFKAAVAADLLDAAEPRAVRAGASALNELAEQTLRANR
jgi:excisionase family DNA binding protein